MTICYCGNHLPFENCCQPYIKGLAKVPTAESLMRSRYSAYVTGDACYLIATTHTSTRKLYKEKDILDWSQSNHWCRLEVLEVTPTTVTFKAHYIDNHRKEQIHYEKSNFVFEDGSWFYVDGSY
jgi:SEC-C motif-containing protein